MSKATVAKPKPLDWSNGSYLDSTASWRENGFTVQAKIVLNEDPDLSFIGEYTDKQEPGVIVRQNGEFIEDWPEDDPLPERGREYRFFKPYAGGEQPGSKDYQTYGFQDYKQMEEYNRGDWCMIGIVVKVFKAGVELSSGSLWGIESNSEVSYFDEIARDLAGEAVEEAKSKLKELCKS